MWTEVPSARSRKAKTWQDSDNPALRRTLSTLKALHYESALGTGIYDAEIDMVAQRIQTAALDGWRITANGWHFGLGQRADGLDGYVGFGGRQGQHWIFSRLERVAWLRWSNRTVTPIGGVATYNRANLSIQPSAVDLPDGRTVSPSASVTWGNLWAGVDARWRVDGDRLKEEIVVSEATRATLAGTFPGGPTSGTYLTMAFRLDASDIPQWIKAGVAQSLTGDFDDNDGTTPFELRNASGEALGFLPLDDVYVVGADGLEIEGSRRRLRKRIYTDAGTTWLLIGVRADVLNAMPAGTLVFDPTIDDQVDASADDAYHRSNGAKSYTTTFLPFYDNTGTRYNIGMRWTTTGLPQGATISSAYFEAYAYDTGRDKANFTLYGEDVDSPVDFATNTDITNRTRTTASAGYTAQYTAPAWVFNDVDISTIVQELTDRAGFGGDICLLAITPGTLINEVITYSQDNGSNAPKLHIVYTAGSSDPAVTVSDTVTGSESVTAAVSAPQGSTSDTVTVSEAVNLSIVSAGVEASATDSVTVSETVSASVDTSVSVADTVTVSESVAAQVSTAGIAVTDSVTLGETVAVAVSVAASVSDSLTVADNASASVSTAEVNATDSVAVGETVTTIVSVAVSAAESLTVGESVNVSVTSAGQFTVSVSDTVTTGETVNAAVSDPQVDAAETVTLGESVTVSVGVVGQVAASVSDSLTVSDTATLGVDTSVSMAEALTTAETVTAQVSVSAVASDNLTVGESVTVSIVAIGAILVSVSDSVTVGESVLATVSTAQVDVSDSIVTAELVAVAVIEAGVTVVSVSDTVAVGETVTVQLSESAIAVTDSITVGETVTAVLLSAVSIADSVTVTDTATVAPIAIAATAIESVSLAETVTAVVGTALVSVSDSINIVDTPNMGTPAVPGGELNVNVSDSLTVGDLIVMFILATPASRTYAVEAENRIFAVGAEDRRFSIAAEDRTYSVY